MSTVFETIYSIWTADATATALVPASRFKVPGNWQNLDRPYVIQWPIYELPTIVHKDIALQTLRRRRIQMSVFADSFSSAEPVVDKLRSVFTGCKSAIQFKFAGSHWNDEDEVTGVQHYVVEFDVAYAF